MQNPPDPSMLPAFLQSWLTITLPLFVNKLGVVIESVFKKLLLIWMVPVVELVKLFEFRKSAELMVEVLLTVSIFKKLVEVTVPLFVKFPPVLIINCGALMIPLLVFVNVA